MKKKSTRYEFTFHFFRSEKSFRFQLGEIIQKYDYLDGLTEIGNEAIEILKYDILINSREVQPVVEALKEQAARIGK